VIANRPTFIFGYSYGHKQAMCFCAILVTAKTDHSLTASLSFTAVTGKTSFGQSLLHIIGLTD